MENDFWKLIVLIVGSSVLIALGMYVLAVGNGDVQPLAPRGPSYQQNFLPQPHAPVSVASAA